ncbi:hypothetical protein [Oceanobacillus jeddahense]|uniref:DUF2273 domain-containing protein n=1 Tax=Oceanobacillus jeddahense TaxID=1462527 RepID=A0ABY5JQW5_9BACI|nr:hypothetical protein [Oceanobacillus jeddahense]UUI02185.1 hypothetical protein NP439_19400 [Oceanobacillus jeddahense]
MTFSGNLYLWITGLGLIIGIVFDILLYGLLIGAGVGAVAQYWASNKQKA